MTCFVEYNEIILVMCYSFNRGEDNMPGYILVEDIFDEMSQNISYIKLNYYLKEGRKS